MCCRWDKGTSGPCSRRPSARAARPGSNHVGISWERGEKDGALCPHWDEGLYQGADYFTGYRVLLGAEDHRIRTFAMCSKVH